MGKMRKSLKTWFPMDYGFSKDFKVSTFQDKFGLTGYAVLVKLFESYIEMPSFSIDIGLESVAISYLSRYIPMPKKRVIFYLQGMLECGLLLEDENGLLFSKRMQEHLTKTLEKHQHYVDGNTGKNIKQPEQICNKQGTNQKQTVNQTCVKPAQVDTNFVKDVFDYWNSKDIIVHSKLNQATKQQIVKRLKEYILDQIKASIDNYKIAITDDEFYSTIPRKTLCIFMKQENWMPVFLTWKPKTKVTKTSSYVQPLKNKAGF